LGQYFLQREALRLLPCVINRRPAEFLYRIMLNFVYLLFSFPQGERNKETKS